MITGSNTDVIAKQLQEFSKEVERKLHNMIGGFAMEVATAASNNTPEGSSDMFIDGSRYRNYYLNRQDEFGLPIEPGYHKGAWQYTESGNPTFNPNIYTTSEMANDVFAEASASYKLGESFSIAATGPGYDDIEKGRSGKAPQGVIEPTVNQIMASHEVDLKRYYEAG